MVSLRDNGGPSQDGITCIDNNRANIVTVLSGRGVISSLGEVDTWVIPGVDPFRTYLVEILGAASNVDVWGQNVGGSLTLADPHPVSLYHEDGRFGNMGFNSAPGDFGTGRNSRFIFIFSTYGDFVLKVKSGESGDDQGTGSYHLLVRYDNYCIVGDDGSIVFPFEGGPEGYAFDIRNDTGTRFEANVRHSSDLSQRPYFAGGHLLGDNWGSEPDEDWIRFELEEDTEYEVYLEGADHYPVEHRLTRPRIVGIFDKDGVLFHEGAAGSGTDTSVSLTFQTTSSGKYYLGVGSNPGDRTGVYSYHVSETESNNARRAAANNSPTGGPGIKGLPRIGEELTVTTSLIADADGLENASFSYQWVRHNPLDNTDTDIPGATGATYTITRQDRDRAIKVRVEFTDDGDNHEKLTSFAVLILPPDNTPAAGQPTITGTLEVGQILTAGTSAISDADRMDNATFGYRWIAGDSDIQNATGMSLTLTEDEEGLAIRVSVTFTDDAENKETLTSDPTGLVQPRPNAPVIRGAARVGETLTVDTSGISDADGMENASFAYRWLAGGTDIPGATGSNYTLTEDDEGLTILVWVSFTDDDGNPKALASSPTGAVAPRNPPPAPENLTGTANSDGSVTLSWEAPDDDSVTGYQILRRRPRKGENTLLVQVNDTGSTATEYTDGDVTPDVLYAYRVKAINPTGLGGLSNYVNVTPVNPVDPVQNSPAMGRPTISGTTRVGEKLTADTSGIADADGLTKVSHRYQWIASDGGADVDITGATGSTYTLVTADRGLYIKVRVSFKDDAGNNENLTSVATDEVGFAAQQQASNSPATGQPTIIGPARVGETLTADTSGIVDADGLTKVSHRYQWVANDGDTDADISGATGSTYTLVADDVDKTIKVKVTVTDDVGNETTLTSAATDAVDFAVQQQASNSPATGQPTIIGTLEVGQILTADTSDIVDADGLTKVSHRYQWVANDGDTDADISGATGSTYTLVADDVDKTIKVRVTVTDDVGNETTLTSAATDAVDFAVQQQQASNSPATGQPTITGTLEVGQILTADTSDIVDADGLTKVSHRYQWVANDGDTDADISGATGSTYTLVADDVDKTIKVRVIVTDDAANETTLTSEATDAVDAAAQPDSPATGQPTISGTAQVGEMLTADTSGIADADGLDNGTYSYQWLGDDTDIAGATSSTYTLLAGDEGQTIKVRVVVTDDAENETTLTSAATEAVEAPEPPAKPTGLSAAVSHDTVTLTWDNPQDDSITGYVILRRDRKIHLVGTFITITGDTGSADTTYTDDTVEPDKQYVYRIKAINEHGEVSEESDWVRGFTPAAPVPAG